MPFTTALTVVDGGRLQWCNQNALRFYDRIAFDDTYNGVAVDEAEVERLARQLAGKDKPQALNR
jgi:hypothetical protein